MSAPASRPGRWTPKPADNHGSSSPASTPSPTAKPPAVMRRPSKLSVPSPPNELSDRTFVSSPAVTTQSAILAAEPGPPPLGAKSSEARPRLPFSKHHPLRTSNIASTSSGITTRIGRRNHAPNQPATRAFGISSSGGLLPSTQNVFTPSITQTPSPVRNPLFGWRRTSPRR